MSFPWSWPPSSSLVRSVFGRVGAVVAAAGDYAASLITNDSGVAGATVADALDTLNAAAAVQSVFGRTGAVVAVLNDYAASLVDNDSGVAGATVKDALDTLAAATPPGPTAGMAERATDLSIPTASGFVLVTSLALPGGVGNGDTVDLWATYCGINNNAATVSYEVRQGATVLDKGYSTGNAGWAWKVSTRRLIALVSNAAVDLYVSTNSGTFSIRPATVTSEHGRIGLVKYG